MTDSERTDRELLDEMHKCEAVIRPAQQRLDQLNAEWMARHVGPCRAGPNQPGSIGETDATGRMVWRAAPCLEPMAGVTIR